MDKQFSTILAFTVIGRFPRGILEKETPLEGIISLLLVGYSKLIEVNSNFVMKCELPDNWDEIHFLFFYNIKNTISFTQHKMI